jgi:hypothetical protein
VAPRQAKSISTGAPKMPPKTWPAQNLGLGPKLVRHRQAQNRVSARWILNKQSELPRRPLHGRTLSEAPAPCGTLEKWPRICLAGKMNHQILLLPRLPPFGAAVAGDDAHLSRSPPPPLAKKKALYPASASPPPSSGKVSAASTVGTSVPLTGDAPPRSQGVRPFASPAAMDSDDELMMVVL